MWNYEMFDGLLLSHHINSIVKQIVLDPFMLNMNSPKLFYLCFCKQFDHFAKAFTR
ncbi:hypothetical protein CR513_37056, partial [Mucuna pruriens]